MKPILSVITLTLMLGTSLAKAQGGGMAGGGGDARTENRIHGIRDNILEWIFSGNAKKLVFPEGLSYEVYLKGDQEKQIMGMVEVLTSDPEKAVVVTAIRDREEDRSNEELNTWVDGQPKTCKGFISQRDKRAHVLCNVERFWSLNDDEQIIQIHHEYASLARIEKNSGAASDLRLSSQLSKEIKTELVRRLPVSQRIDLGSISTADGLNRIEIYCSSGTRARCKELTFGQWVGSSQKIILIAPAGVQGGGNWYDLKPAADRLPWVFGFNGRMLFPQKKNAWSGIPIMAQQESSLHWGQAETTISEALTSSRAIVVGNKKFDSVLNVLSALNSRSKNLMSGLPQGAGGRFSDIPWWLLW